METRLISREDPLYREEVELRYRILRAPLGIRREDVKYPYDVESLHFVGVEARRVVGCAMFRPEAPREGRLLQMAVEAELQGRGLGRQIVRFLEDEVGRRGYETVTLHARGDKVGFYEKLGYAVRGEEFVEVDIPHRLMWRRLGGS